jgi:tetratricopeptide (TPR) repeat protein
VARNREAFRDAMRMATDAAWDKDWPRAVEAYQQALTEFPDDSNALVGLGIAYSRLGQPEEALDAYQRAKEFVPEDPVLLERIGRAWEQLGKGESAADAYLASAESYLKQQADHLALERWQDAARACSHCVKPHVNLLRHYQQQRQVEEAVGECLALAHIYQEQGQIDYAIQICQHALKLDARNTQVLTLLDNLRYGGTSQTAAESDAEMTEEEAGQVGIEGLTDIDWEGSATPSEAETTKAKERGSPVEKARDIAIEDIAESVFEDEEEEASTAMPQLSKMETDMLIGRALDAQTRGKVEDAIEAYEAVEKAGVDRPAVHFSLGLLYQEQLRFKEAISQFERAITQPDYRLGSHFALGECHRALGRIDEALEHFVEALKIVDLSTVRRGQADDLIQLYEHLADGYITKGDQERAIEFMNALVVFLSEQGWEDKVKSARQRLDELAQDGPSLSLAEMLTVPGSERILESIALSQEYVKRGLFYAAVEECYYALGQAPSYLPIHWQLGQVFLAMGKTDTAMSKFNAIGNTYRMRGNIRQAVAVYERVLKVVPMDIAVRAKLIDLLVSHGEIDRALDHYLMMADSYYHLAQMGQAREIYQEALRLAPRGDPERRWEVRILHKIGDLDMQRVDWKHALGVYERIRELAPDDERAHLSLMDLYYRFNRPKVAIKELDSLLKIYREDDRSDRVFAVLDDAVERWPDNIPIRARLAQAHLNAGHSEQALEHLDRLGDLQLNAGRPKEARSTIQAIIALNPPNIESYRQLLEQLE